MSSSQVNAKYRIPDELWERLQPLLPPAMPKPKGGRPRLDDRQALEAIFGRAVYGLSVECIAT